MTQHMPNTVRRGYKKQKLSNDVHVSPIVFGQLLGTHNNKTLRILLDSGASSSIIFYQSHMNLSLVDSQSTKWNTSAGPFHTNKRAQIQFRLPEFNQTAVIKTHVHVSMTTSTYNMIMGRDLLHELGIDLQFSTGLMTWKDITIPMKTPDCTVESQQYIADSKRMQQSTDRIKRILDAKYEPADLLAEARKASQLNEKEQMSLYHLLKKYEPLFDGTLGCYTGDKYHIETRKDAVAYHARPYPIPKTYENTLKQEVERLVHAGVLKKVNRSEWAAPTFIIPKKDGSVRFISDFQELNKRIKRKPYPIPKIQDLLLKLEGFTYGTSLDLNMGYYHIELNADLRKLCTIVLPWGKYEYCRLPMGLCNSPDIFQEKINNTFSGLDYVQAYIDDILCLSKGDWNDHLCKLEEIFKRLSAAGLKVNAKKSFFGVHELEYLGYWITRKGIQPVAKKIDAIHNIDTPKNRKQLRRFIGIINYYRDMWVRRSDILAPLTALTSKNVKWHWTDVHQKAFETMKKTISRDALLAYPNFNKTFEIHTDASKTQLGAVISQDNKPIAFYSRKLNPAQTRYTTTERELLAIVETLKEFRNILLGQKIKVYTDHKNLTYKNFNTERVMRWRLILEEYGPQLEYIKGEKNVLADALSRLDIKKDTIETLEQMAQTIGLNNEDLPSNAFPLKYKLIEKAQKRDQSVQNLIQKKDYTSKTFRGGGKEYTLICRNDKIVVPKIFQQRLVEWYHYMLCHPGETRTEETIKQHFTWKGLRSVVHDICTKCPTCQKYKKSYKKYGHLPEKEAKGQPWQKLCVDLIGPYNIAQQDNKKPLSIRCATMIDPAAGWFEIRRINDKQSYSVAQQVEFAWLTRYPWPDEIIYDQGTEFLGDFSDMIKEDYPTIKQSPITTRNPQANGILERAHATISNIIRTMDLDNDEDHDPWEGVLAATMFAMQSTYHTTLQATPAQLVFGQDSILNIQFDANWNFIKARKQAIIRKNNQNENSKRINHTYNIGDKVLCVNDNQRQAKFGHELWAGPYRIQAVNDNGTVTLKMGSVIDKINIRRIKPYRE